MSRCGGEQPSRRRRGLPRRTDRRDWRLWLREELSGLRHPASRGGAEVRGRLRPPRGGDASGAGSRAIGDGERADRGGRAESAEPQPGVAGGDSLGAPPFPEAPVCPLRRAFLSGMRRSPGGPLRRADRRDHRCPRGGGAGARQRAPVPPRGGKPQEPARAPRGGARPRSRGRGRQTPRSRRALAAGKPHDVDLILGTLAAGANASTLRRKGRDLLDRAIALGGGGLVVATRAGRTVLSRSPVCPECGRPFHRLDPVHFHVLCRYCGGRGCAECAESASVRWAERSIRGLLAASVEELQMILVDRRPALGGDRLFAEVRRRLDALCSVGLGYVGLDRPVPTLSRGEQQRLRLAVALSSRLEDLVHILDEPTIGQHPRDVASLVACFRALGGPVVFVEHDRGAAFLADRAVEIGPEAGSGGAGSCTPVRSAGSCARTPTRGAPSPGATPPRRSRPPEDRRKAGSGSAAPRRGTSRESTSTFPWAGSRF